MNWHWDHSKKRSIKGINFITALYHANGVSIPVAFEITEKTEQYIDNKTGKEKRRSPISKKEHLRAMLHQCVKNNRNVALSQEDKLQGRYQKISDLGLPENEPIEVIRNCLVFAPAVLRICLCGRQADEVSELVVTSRFGQSQGIS